MHVLLLQRKGIKIRSFNTHKMSTFFSSYIFSSSDASACKFRGDKTYLAACLILFHIVSRTPLSLSAL